MFLHSVFIKREAQAGRVWHGNISILDDWLMDAVNKISPERDICKMMFQRNEVLGSCSAMDRPQRADCVAPHVQRHAEAMLLCDIAYLFCFEDPTTCGKV